MSSLILAVTRGTGSLPHQSLKQKLTLLGLRNRAADQGRTTDPAQFECASVSANAASLDGVCEMVQSISPTEAIENVGP
jgi:hypothetical protein